MSEPPVYRVTRVTPEQLATMKADMTAAHTAIFSAGPLPNPTNMGLIIDAVKASVVTICTIIDNLD